MSDDEKVQISAAAHRSLVRALKSFSGFRCEHQDAASSLIGPPEKCLWFDRGGICNSCWARGWAQEMKGLLE